ncbi:uncharacterized protein RSE6_02463 [Rhynchosporium secalis]|uniref:Rhodopsin domain-containing protein n=1 Tax=Rhynchosporium secalis TaxID=38038 RepID=A0A1E1M0A1_RHYSE|nr:uncharacterized protein RSE6_02463 [Rhynchosporium secalis]
MFLPRAEKEVVYISPVKEVNIGLWVLLAGATVFLGLRLYCKISRRTGLWYDDYVLTVSWLVLFVNDIIIVDEWSTGHEKGNWDDRTHILIKITSCGTLIGQALSKTALGITLLRMSNKKQAAILWFCIVSMNSYMIIKCFFQWAKLCNHSEYNKWYNLQGPCLNYDVEEKIKIGGNTYNIIMDFVLAAFPWWITWNLEMRRVEKFALCVTMSLGIVVAIISAIRTSWKDRPSMQVHDERFLWRNGMANIWYSAEIAGTIIVQCIPILRPLLRDIIVTTQSRRTGGDSIDRSHHRSTAHRSQIGIATFDPKDAGVPPHITESYDHGTEEVYALDIIPEEPETKRTSFVSHCPSFVSQSPSEIGRLTPTVNASPLTRDSDSGWSYSVRSDKTDLRSPGFIKPWEDGEEPEGLSPPPRPARVSSPESQKELSSKIP